MLHTIIISGFGGQGVMAMGKTLAEAGMKEGMNVSWLPSYGPEMRGGTANCNLVISSEPVISPMVIESTEVIAMNKPSLLKFEKSLYPGGMLFINSSIVEISSTRTDIKTYYVPCNDIAAELGTDKAANMVMLGAYIEATKVLKVDTIKEMLTQMFTGPKAKYVELNIEALRRGAQCVNNN